MKPTLFLLAALLTGNALVASQALSQDAATQWKWFTEDSKRADSLKAAQKAEYDRRLLEGLRFDGLAPIRIEPRRPHMGVALPLSILYTGGAIGSFVAAGQATEQSGGYIVLGVICTGLAINFTVQAFRTEHWAVYSNGMEIRVQYDF